MARHLLEACGPMTLQIAARSAPKTFSGIWETSMPYKALRKMAVRTILALTCAVTGRKRSRLHIFMASRTRAMIVVDLLAAQKLK